MTVNLNELCQYVVVADGVTLAAFRFQLDADSFANNCKKHGVFDVAVKVNKPAVAT